MHTVGSVGYELIKRAGTATSGGKSDCVTCCHTWVTEEDRIPHGGRHWYAETLQRHGEQGGCGARRGEHVPLRCAEVTCERGDGNELFWPDKACVSQPEEQRRASPLRVHQTTLRMSVLSCVFCLLSNVHRTKSAEKHFIDFKVRDYKYSITI